MWEHGGDIWGNLRENQWKTDGETDGEPMWNANVETYGDTYGAHREALELSIEDHKILQDHCKSIGLEYSCSVQLGWSQHLLFDLGKSPQTHY